MRHVDLVMGLLLVTAVSGVAQEVEKWRHLLEKDSQNITLRAMVGLTKFNAGKVHAVVFADVIHG